MPIRLFEQFLFENNVVGTFPLTHLKNARIGIDVEHYIARLVNYQKFPYLEAIGELPQVLMYYLNSDLEFFRESNMKPTFVFSGVATPISRSALPPTPVGRFLDSEKHRHDVWVKYYTLYRVPTHHIELFREFNTYPSVGPFMNDLMQFFYDNGIEYMVAPYSSWAQLAYLYQEDYIDTIYGPTDLCLVEKIDKFILGFDVPNKGFKFVDKQRIFQEFHINQKQLDQAACIVGFDLQPEVLSILPPVSYANPFKVCLELIYSGIDLHHHVLALGDRALVEAYEKAWLGLQFLPVMKSNGSVQLFNTTEEPASAPRSAPATTGSASKTAASVTSAPPHTTVRTVSRTNGNGPHNQNPIIEVPNDVHEVVGQQLPLELFFYLRYGLIHPEMLTTVLAGRQEVRPPLDGGRALLYRELVLRPEVVELMDKRVNLLTALLARYYQFKKIPMYVWFVDNGTVPVQDLNNRFVPTVQKLLVSWSVHADANSPREFGIADFLSSLDPAFVAAHSAATLPPAPFTTRYEIAATATLRALLLMGHVDKTGPTAWMRSFVRFVNLLEPGLIKPVMLERLVYLLEYMRVSSTPLHAPFDPSIPELESNRKQRLLAAANPAFYPVPLLGTDYLSMLVMTRVMLLMLTTTYRLFLYLGLVLQLLLAFRGHMETIREQFRLTVQAVLVLLLCNGELLVRQTWSSADWTQLALELPFARLVPNTLMGVWIEVYIELVRNYNGDRVAARDQLELLTHMVQLLDMGTDLFVRGVAFWRHFMQMVHVLHEDGLVNADEYERLQEADEMWQQYFDK